MKINGIKARIVGRKLFYAAALAVIIQQAPIKFVGTSYAQTTAVARGVFADSDYGYCDAKKVAAVWRVNIDRAKVVIGHKIIGNITHLIDADIATTSGRVTCNWDELQMSYNDAVVLGNYWGKRPFEAKSKAESIATDWGKKRLRQFIFDQIGYRIS